ncbi:HsdM family class I SAM-dependent methyltransferase [Gluconobacter japonicus]|uniref:site-specific DNA-methyltransferase (adenine-specific) n=1 Tax=Gluconobacter japonicus TaxID=376620 RepID=A0A9Q2FP31_GLUJA|nr:N-6 DNA methylase [Gluconobacter japonicus]MBF0871781.1 SAM-dependent DNA methyltransferase [Gluconobacter japonicus]
MTSAAFKQALEATGYLGANGRLAPGFVSADDPRAARMRAVFSDDRVGLNADAVFSAQNAPTSIFKDAGHANPSEADLRHWQEAAWNVGVAPLLWIITPADVRLYDCYSLPEQADAQTDRAPQALDRFVLDSADRLRALDAQCGRVATETGAFWSSAIGSKIDRRHRVDRELLAEISALEDRLTVLGEPQTDEALTHARDIAQRFIGRCIFTWYLLDRGIAQPFLPSGLPADLSAMFATPANAFALFDWLRTTFNGDLFPMDDPGAEREQLTSQHLALIRDFIEGRSLIPERSGQGRLFRFRFNAIPIDLVSSIYQQFARTSAADEARSQGLHYTPVELVHLTLDPVFEALTPNARIIDPACGSGAFLVEAFRRLVWRASEGKPASRQIVRHVLYNQLFGIDINRAALGIAAFSLYLAALELDEEPVKDIIDLKFDRLIDTTLFEADSLGSELPNQIASRTFDAVVGNPPWTFVTKGSVQKRRSSDTSTLRPRRSPDQAFLALGADLAGDHGRIGMVMKATPFFSKDIHAIAARTHLLERLAPVALINLSYLRREDLFPNAIGPALLFFARCALGPNADRLLVGSIPWTPDFRRTGVFHLGPGEIRSVPLKRVLATPSFLKAATFGTVRDGWLIERLEREFPTLDRALTNIGIKKRINRGQGFKVKGREQTKSPDDYAELAVVTPDNFTPFRLTADQLDRFTHETLHRVRSRSIFRGPLLLCSKVGSNAGAQRGRYSAALNGDDVLYTQGYFGISFADADPRLAFLLSGILNSSLTAFQFALGGPTWGLERPTVEPHDLLSLRIPLFDKCDPAVINAVIDAEKEAAATPDDISRLDRLDDTVFELYGLEPDERILARESVARARYLIFENRAERIGLVATPDTASLHAYAGQVAGTVDAYLRARNERHLEAVIYPVRLSKADLAAGIPGVTAVRFVMAPGGPADVPIVRDGNPAELQALSALLRGQLEADIPPYLNERRQMRLYGPEDLFILKPAEIRYWTRTAGLNDADIILADHWMRRRDVATHA